MHRSYPDIRRRGGSKNWFGDGTLGDVVISADTALAATADGDMVVANYKSLTVNAGKTLSVANRCRGALIYVQGDCVISGTLTMTARGAHANPAESATSTDTPVAPTDGHAVPADGVTIRRLAAGYTDTDEDFDLMYGCGSAAVAAEAHQPVVRAAGRVIRIPRLGGAGAAASTALPKRAGLSGGVLANAPGGGAGGGCNLGNAGAGGDATCFSGGAASGGCDGGSTTPSTADANDYGGAGSDAYGEGSQYQSGGGAGNPPGAGDGGSAGGIGTGGLLVLIVGGTLSGSGVISADGMAGGAGSICGGGGSGGGVVVVLYGTASSWAGTVRANGGAGGTSSYYAGGAGGAGSVVGPHKIDPV